MDNITKQSKDKEIKTYSIQKSDVKFLNYQANKIVDFETMESKIKKSSKKARKETDKKDRKNKNIYDTIRKQLIPVIEKSQEIVSGLLVNKDTHTFEKKEVPKILKKLRFIRSIQFKCDGLKVERPSAFFLGRKEVFDDYKKEQNPTVIIVNIGNEIDKCFSTLSEIAKNYATTIGADDINNVNDIIGLSEAQSQNSSVSTHDSKKNDSPGGLGLYGGGKKKLKKKTTKKTKKKHVVGSNSRKKSSQKRRRSSY